METLLDVFLLPGEYSRRQVLVDRVTHALVLRFAQAAYELRPTEGFTARVLYLLESLTSS